MSLRFWPTAIALAVVAAGVVAAQPPPPAPSTEPGIRLAYRWVPGQTHRISLNARGEMQLRMEGAAGAPPMIPLTLTLNGGGSQRVIGATREGVGTVKIAIDSAKMLFDVFGMQMTMQLRQGKVTLLMNGQPLPGGAQGAPGLPAGMGLEQLARPVTVRVDRTGRVVGTPAVAGSGVPFHPFGGGQFASFASVDHWFVPLPDRPVQTGEKWENRREFEGPLPMGVGPPESRLKLLQEETHTLRAVEEQAGRKIAVIDSTIALTGKGNEAFFGDMRFTMRSTSRFDIGRGQLTQSTADLEMAMVMTPPAGAVPQADGPQRIGIDGTMKLTMRLTPVAATRPPARSTPARPRR